MLDRRLAQLSVRIIACIALSLVAVPMYAGDVQPGPAPVLQPGGKADDAPWGEVSSGLQSRLIPERQIVEVQEGEQPQNIDVWLTYEVRAVGDRTLRFLPWDTPLDAFQDASFRVVGPDGNETASYGGAVLDRPWLPPPSLKHFLCLSPEVTVSRRVRLTYDFTKPGLYRVSYDTARQPPPDGRPNVLVYTTRGFTGEVKIDNVWVGEMSTNAVTVEVVRPGAGQAARTSTAPWGPVPDALQCRLLPDRQKIYVQEGQKPEETEVRLTYELRNIGQTPLMFLLRNTPLEEVKGPIFLVTRADGKEVRYVGIQKDRPPVEQKDFTPVLPETVVARTVVLPWDFTEPGQYFVSISSRVQPIPYGGSHDLVHLRQALEQLAKGLQPEDKIPEIVTYYGNFLERAEHNSDNVWTGELTSNTVAVEVVRPGTGPGRYVLTLQEALEFGTVFANKALEGRRFPDALGTLRYPKLSPADWRVARREGNRWVLKHWEHWGGNGFGCSVSFYLDGSDPKLEDAGFAIQ